VDVGESRLFLGADHAVPEVIPVAGGTCVAVSRASPRHPEGTGNEDGAMILEMGEDSGLLAVADGVGGGPAGAEAAAVALRTMAETVGAAVREGHGLRAPVIDGIEHAQAAVLAVGGGAATTLAVVEIGPETIRPYHVGDSEILLTGQRGRVKLRTLSHSPVAYAVESGLLEERDALHHDDRHLVTNALGIPDMRFDVGSPIRLAPRDTLLLATDGLVDNLYPDEIVEGIRIGPLERRMREVGDLARRRMERSREDDSAGPPLTSKPGKPGKPDDLTILLFRRGRGRERGRRKGS
jgi:serine/threonine protein phosphatase PrpC